MALNICRNLLWVFRRYSSFPGPPRTIEDCYSLFFLDHTCSIEELRAAYTTTVRRYSDKIENIREIDRAYYRILRDLKEAEDARVRDDPGDAPGLSRYLLNLENYFGTWCLHKHTGTKCIICSVMTWKYSDLGNWLFSLIF